ncbi:MAG: FAD:protein FMN transferase [Planctomycetales bacterium]
MSNRENPSRRDLLRGLTQTTLPASETERQALKIDPTEETYLLRIGRRAMACEFQIFLNAGQYEHDTQACLAALDRVEELEQILSVYQEDSEVSLVNQRASSETVTVGREVSELLELSLNLYHETEGAFDVTAGILSEIWGFARRSGAMPAADQLSQALEKVGSQHVELEGQTVRFRQAEIQINFGGIGKGYALDCSAEKLTQAGFEHFLFHGGKSSVMARGQRSAEGGPVPWTVGLIHPLRPEQRLAEISLPDRALSTSGSRTQSFHFQGRRYGHILDPRTGSPAEGVYSVTVLADCAATADALSTALFVLGPQRAGEFCRRHPEIAVLLVLPNSNQGSVVIETHNLDQDAWRVLDDTAIIRVC